MDAVCEELGIGPEKPEPSPAVTPVTEAKTYERWVWSLYVDGEAVGIIKKAEFRNIAEYFTDYAVDGSDRYFQRSSVRGSLTLSASRLSINKLLDGEFTVVGTRDNDGVTYELHCTSYSLLTNNQDLSTIDMQVRGRLVCVSAA